MRFVSDRRLRMNTPKKMAFVFGDTALTLCPDDIMAVWAEYEKSHPGKTARDMSSDEFSKRLLPPVAIH